ncbi:MAG TPA: YidC/Oxa1 family membrane protein insertase [Synergistales bacterium]|nr:YidC/Oxa1 family membrane protein insertase [Synergistales bacterium]
MGTLWNQAGELLLKILNLFYALTHSYGIAIILLTILVRVVLHPLNQKQLVSMQKMQKIQPRIKTLQEKYGHDKQKLNEETMKLYKENQVNPAAGCLPLLVQLPILILLFRVLTNFKFGGVSFLGVGLEESVLSTMGKAVGLTGQTPGITALLTGIAANPSGLLNVGMYAPNLILLVSIGFLTWFQQKLSASNNPQMAFMNWFMPVFLTFICLNLPGGVLLYWGVSSLLSVVQQWRVVKVTELEMEKKPVLFKNKPTRDGDS